MNSKEFYVDEECVVSFFIGEVGWFLQYHQGYLRYLKKEVYPDRKFLIFMNDQFHVFVHDFISFTLRLPDWFYDLKLETDCYESPLPNSAPGSLTPPNVYSKLIEYIRQFYNTEKAIEVFPPRGCAIEVAKSIPQIFVKYKSDKINSDKPIVSIFPRGRSRASFRNVPEYIWKDLVDILKEECLVVLGGTPSGSYLVDYKDDNVVNLISYNKDDKTDKIVEYLCNSEFSISSQSGPSHMSLLCDCPSLIIGHEMERHAIELNRFKTPVSFRYVTDYRAIDVETILNDIKGFKESIKQVDDSFVSVENDKEKLDVIMEERK